MPILSLPDYVEIYSSLDQFVELLKMRRAYRQAAQSMFTLLSSETSNGPYCNTIVVEKEYVDRDYLDAFGKYYVRSFHKYPARSMRFHFFREKILEKDICFSSDSGNWSQQHDFLQQSYLGYSVLQPSQPDAIGRTWISPSFTIDGPNEKYDVPAQGMSRVNLLGWPLQAVAPPFIEQDARVAACATAAIWMSHTSLYHKLNLLPISMTKITELASEVYLPVGRAIPSSGLTLEQIIWALNAMRYGPHSIRVSGYNTEYLRAAILAYIESEIPVILGVQLESGGGHALTMIGYTHHQKPEFTSRQEQQSFSSYYSAEQWVENFIIHDDQRGPYHLLSIESPPPFQKDSPQIVKRCNQLRQPLLTISAGYGHKQKEILSRACLVSVTVPLPLSVLLTAEGAIAKSWRCLQTLRDKAKESNRPLPLPKQMIFRTRLVASNRFKEQSLTRDLTPELAHRYRTAHLSRYLWVTEVSSLVLWNTASIHDQRILGEIVLDATSNPHALDFIFIHLPGYLAEMGIEWSNDLEAIEEAARGAATLSDDHLYQPLRSPYPGLL